MNESTALQVHTGTPPESRALAEFAPMTFEQVVAMGDALVRTGFLPEHIKNGAQAAAIILTGRELNMPPMRSLRSLAMVKGKVTEYADSQLARFKADGGRAAWRQLDDKVATLFLRHPNGDEHEESFTFEDAERAGLTKPARSGEPSMYAKHPKAMLRSRAITAGLKSIGWEGGVGTYDPGEALAFSAPADVDYQVDAAPASNGTSSSIDDRAPLDEAEPSCPTCGGRMRDNRLSKRNAKAPDYKCRDNSCTGAFWPNQWPPTPPATESQKARIAELLNTVELTDAQREKTARIAGNPEKPINAKRADEIIARLEKLDRRGATPAAASPTTTDVKDEDDGLPF
jgi:hypothetical protein